MNIMIISLTKGVYPLNIGGVEVHVYNLAKYLQQFGNDVTILASKYNVFERNFFGLLPKIEEYNIDNIRIVLAHNFYSLQKIVKDMSRKTDIIHIHAYRSVPINPSIFRRMEIPKIFTPHAIFPPKSCIVNILQKTYDKSIGVELFNQMDRIIALNHKNKQELITIGANKEKIIIVPNSINIEEFSKVPTEDMFRERFGIYNEYLLFNGRLTYHKGVHLLIKAFSRISANSDTTLVLIGKGEKRYKSFLSKLVRKYKIENRVVFIKELPRKLQLSAYAGAKIFVLSSYQEGLPTVLLEAMIMGKVTITSEAAGEEIIQNRKNGFIFKTGDLESLYDALLQGMSLSKKEEREISYNAISTVKKRYDWKKNIKKIIAIYEEVTK